jgi:P2 family phage contractile tail tube protein
MLDDILKNMALFVDGRGYAGNVEELTLPKLTMKTERFEDVADRHSHLPAHPPGKFW